MFIIGIDIGGTNIDIGIIDNEGDVQYSDSIPTLSQEGPENCIKRIIATINKLINDNNILKETITGIGVGAPGPLDIDKGKMIESPNFPKSWHGYSIKDALSDQLGLAVEIDNDANAAALGELWVGGGQGIDDFIVLTIGTGIGGGIIANGKIVRGSGGLGAEFGHMCIYPDGQICTCGKQGCMEAYASAKSMVNMAKNLIQDPSYQKGSSSLEQRRSGAFDAKFIFEQARAGDKLAAQIVKKAGQTLGIGLGSLLNIFNPSKVILTGRMAQALDILEPHIQEECQKHAFDSMVQSVSIESSQLGDYAGLIGAAAVFAYEHELIKKTPLIYNLHQPFTIVAINVGASGMRVAIVDIHEQGRSYKILKQKHIPGKQPNEGAILNAIYRAFKKVLSGSTKKFSDLKGFSVTTPGPIDRKGTQVLTPPNVNWFYVHLEDKLYRKINKPENLDIPLYLERDAIAITLAEQLFGYGRNLKNFAAIYIGTGVGAGFVFNGEVFYGVQDHAGEFGHGIIDLHSKKSCHCGNKGCLECFASGWSLIDYCVREINEGASSVLSTKVDSLHYNDIRDAANQNDELALVAFKKMGEAMGIGLSNLINYLDLEKVIISGPLARGSRHYLDEIRAVAAENIIITTGSKEWCKNNIVATELDDAEIEIAGAVAAFINQHSIKEERR